MNTKPNPAPETSGQLVFITGGYGCIGVETTRWLIQNTACQVLIGSRQVSTERNTRLFGDVDPERIKFAQVDVRDETRLRSILAEHPITRVAHLAGLQTPDCNTHRDLGLQINLAGTQNVIEALKASNQPIQRFIFASSMAVYGPRSHYRSGRVPMLSETMPVNVYGTWKLACEQLARLFSEDTGIATVSIRPGALFGPGRDRGLTATPTTAMKHVALGLPYEIPYQNEQDYLYAPDVGAAVGNALMEPHLGYAAFTLPSHTVATQEIVNAMQAAARELRLPGSFAITVGSESVPFACDVDYQPFLDAFPKSPRTPLDVAVRESIEIFLEHHHLRG